jgi:hypothetical protein
MDMSAISGLLSSLNSAKDIAQAMIGLRDSKAIEGKLLEFQAELLKANGSALAAQQQQFTLLETVRELKEEVTSLKDWTAQKERYELQQIPSFHKPFAYALKPEMQHGEPPHYICTNCYEHGKRSILQPHAKGGAKLLICHECGAELLLDGRMTISDEALAAARRKR